MKDEGLYKNYSMQKLLDDLNLIERCEFPAKRAHFSEITKKQIALYKSLGVNPPGML